MATDDAAVFAPGTHVGRYELVRPLGKGGLGVVYEARHRELKRRVALKTLHAAHATNAEIRARFVREGELAARLRHPHIIEVFDVGTHEGASFLVMELLVGEDLATLLAREGPLVPARAADLLLPVLAAVATAHDEGVVHRGLKPANVFLVQTREGLPLPKVLDFGISKPHDDGDDPRLTKTASMLGTPSYMSPEQARGAKHLDRRSDQFSLGVMLYECITGNLPFHADSPHELLHAIVRAHFVPPRFFRPDLPAGFEQVILRAMARDPAQRFRDVRALGGTLLPFASARSRLMWALTFAPQPDSDEAAPPTPAPTPTPDLVATAQPTPLEPASRTLVAGAPARNRRVPRWLVAGLGVGVVAGAAAWMLPGRGAPTAAPPTRACAAGVTASPAAVERATAASAPPTTVATPTPVVAPVRELIAVPRVDRSIQAPPAAIEAPPTVAEPPDRATTRALRRPAAPRGPTR